MGTVARGPVPRDRGMARDRPAPYGNPPVGAVLNRAYGELRSVGQDRLILTRSGSGDPELLLGFFRSGSGDPELRSLGMRGPSPYGNPPVGAV